MDRVEKEGGCFYLISFTDENFLLSSFDVLFSAPLAKRDKSSLRQGCLALAGVELATGVKEGGRNELATFN